jgi:hypothetical protein
MATVRWTDAMLDDLASIVSEASRTVNNLSIKIDQVLATVALETSLNDERNRQVGALVDAVNIHQSALRMIAEESQRDRRIAQERYDEQNQRFNILLEEVRATNRRVNHLENHA